MMLSIKNISVNYGHTHVLKGLNFEVSEGELVCIVGKSGCGKSTLLHAIAGFTPFHGEMRKPESVGVVFQKNSVFPWMTVRENIEFAIHNHKYTEQEQERILEEYLRLAWLGDKHDCYPDELSGGQVQRIAFARTLAQNPDLILMDEPFGALDAHTREDMQRWLLDIWSLHRKTIVFVTHDIEEAVFLADRVCILKGGILDSEYHISFIRPRSESIKFEQEFSLIKRSIHDRLAEKIYGQI